MTFSTAKGDGAGALYKQFVDTDCCISTVTRVQRKIIDIRVTTHKALGATKAALVIPHRKTAYMFAHLPNCKYTKYSKQYKARFLLPIDCVSLSYSTRL